MRLPVLAALAAPLALAACGSTYSPDTYATRAVQQANKAEQGVVVGVRQVNISAGGETGAAAGAAAGGVIGSAAPSGIFSALGGVGGAVVGGLVGTAAEHRVVDTTAFEYVVRIAGKSELVSVTQKDQQPLALGTKVLVIAGTQARIVPDYTVAQDVPVPPKPAQASEAPAPAAEPAEQAAAQPPAGNSPLPTIPIPVPESVQRLIPSTTAPNPAEPYHLPAGS